MALTADQAARLTAAHIDAEWQVFVSGPRRSVAEQDVTAGAVYSSFPETTLDGPVDGDDDDITVVSTSGFPDSAAIWIDDGTNPPELVEYGSKTATTFTDTTRDRPGQHNTGASVSQWVEVTEKVRGLDFQESYQAGEVSTWDAMLEGISYDSRLLAQNNAVLVRLRYFPHPSSGDNWSDWLVLAQGYFSAGSTEDDYRQGAEWSKPVLGLQLYLGNSDAPARRYGRANLAIGASATASPELADASLIGHSGEVVGSQDLGPDNLTDDSISTVYVSNDIPQIVDGDPDMTPQDGLFIGEVGWGPVGTGETNGAYFALWATQDLPVRIIDVSNRQGKMVFKDNQELPTITAKSGVIFCYNRETFERWAGPNVEIVEWRHIDSGWTLRQAGDFLGLNINVPGADPTVTVHVRWGDEATGTPWDGLAALDFGQALLKDFSVNAGNDTDWTLVNTPVPGRNANADVWLYASVELDQLAITLDANIGAGTTSIPVSPSTTGLDQDGGTVQIDSEQIPYTSATQTTLEGATVANSHSSGATVFAVDDGGNAHLNEKISTIGWKRKRVEDGNGNPIVPRDFHVFVSTLASPTYPDTDPANWADWQGDWTYAATVHDNANVEWQTADAWPGELVRHALVLCETMSNDGRFILNDIVCMRAASHDPSITTVDSAGGVVEQILDDFALPDVQQQVTAFGPVGTHLVTAKGRYLQRLQEIAQLVGGQVRLTRDNRVVFDRSPWHPVAGLPASTATLNRDKGRRIRGQEGQRNVVSQVQMLARNPETGESYRVSYPPTARPFGDVVEIERIFYGTQNGARYLAELVYKQLNTATEEIFEPVGHADGFSIGDRVILDWDRDASGDQYSGRNFIVVGISLSLRHPLNSPKEVAWVLRLKEYIFG